MGGLIDREQNQLIVTGKNHAIESRVNCPNILGCELRKFMETWKVYVPCMNAKNSLKCTHGAKAHMVITSKLGLTCEPTYVADCIKEYRNISNSMI